MAEGAVQEILIALAEVRKDIKALLEKMEDHEERIRSLEGKSGKRWEALVSQLITLAAAGFVGWALGQIK